MSASGEELFDASNEGLVDKVRTLLAAGADVNSSVGEAVQTALMQASLKGHADVVALLIDSGADVNDINANGRTAVHLAIEGKHVKVVEMLIAHGASLNVADVIGCTSLHMLFCRELDAAPEREAIARLLVANGGDVFATTHAGLRPLDLAIHCRSSEQNRLTNRLTIARLFLDKAIELSSSDTPPYRQTVASLPVKTSATVVLRCLSRACQLYRRSHPSSFPPVMPIMDKVMQRLTEKDGPAKVFLAQDLVASVKELLELGKLCETAVAARVDDLSGFLASAAQHMCKATALLISASVPTKRLAEERASTALNRFSLKNWKAWERPDPFARGPELTPAMRRQISEAMTESVSELARAYALAFPIAVLYDDATYQTFGSAVKEDLTRVVEGAVNDWRWDDQSPVGEGILGPLWPNGEPVSAPNTTSAS